MASTKKRGRPYKGDRRVVWSRIRAQNADAVAAIAAARDGMPMGDVMDALVAVGLAHLDEAELPPIPQGLDVLKAHPGAGRPAA